MSEVLALAERLSKLIQEQKPTAPVAPGGLPEAKGHSAEGSGDGAALDGQAPPPVASPNAPPSVLSEAEIKANALLATRAAEAIIRVAVNHADVLDFLKIRGRDITFTAEGVPQIDGRAINHESLAAAGVPLGLLKARGKSGTGSRGGGPEANLPGLGQIIHAARSGDSAAYRRLGNTPAERLARAKGQIE